MAKSRITPHPQDPGDQSLWVQLPLDASEPPRVARPSPGGEWVEVLVADLAIELGDVEHTPAYQEEVKELWAQSQLSEPEFAKILVEVKARARSWRGRIGHAPPSTAPGLRMKAFVLLLRDRLGLLEKEEQPPQSRDQLRLPRPGRAGRYHPSLRIE